MRHLTLISAICALAAAMFVLFLATLYMHSSYKNLKNWQQNAKTAPEGIGAAELFERAVEGGAIRWNPAIGQLEIRRGTGLEEAVELALFRIGEEGIVISAEINRSVALSSYAAVRAHYPNCEAPCSRQSNWIARIEGNTNEAAQLAAGAAAVRNVNGLPPLPATHFLLSRDVGAGYEAWHVFMPSVVSIWKVRWPMQIT